MRHALCSEPENLCQDGVLLFAKDIESVAQCNMTTLHPLVINKTRLIQACFCAVTLRCTICK